ncbi:hypothetical protein BDF20DRAFT_812484 [Mycotypha africana]|uniref:uncharacterized protein n=1 Tax=Mycotypha africana TaxID=64632 RepID=UPI0023016E01|nr:uncharacterized protein BDF20DRAFT_812484 [Mycotypha africana]KAI8991505.1 hypothetical protein BDF20DRAFT_812484 [Mycotypha africana]
MTGSEIEKSGLLNILQERSDKCRQDRLAFQKRSNALDHANYHLMGVLLVRLEDVALSKPTANTWCLYLRDYRGNNADGSLWRVISKDKEEQATISSDQALADITGQIYGYCNPTVFSRDYRPAYLFYGNIDMLDQSSYSPVAQVDSIKQQQAEEHCNNQDTRNNGGTITFADYTFDDDGYDPNDFGVDYAYSATEAPIEDDTACYHCGKKDEFPNNDIFLCDLCNQGFHQLCEDPPIDNSEIQLDPWYCRTCSKAQNIPLPNLPSSSTRSPCYETTTTSTNITEQKASIPSIEHTNTTAAAHNTAISYTSPLPSNNMSETTSKYFSVENTEASKAEVDDNGDDSLYNNLTKRKRNDEAIVNNHPNNNSRGRNNTARRSRPFQRKLDHF